MTTTQTPARPFLTTAEAAELLGVARDKIIDFIGDGSLVAVDVARHSGGIRPRWRISRAALDAFLVSRQSQPSAPAPQRKRRADAVTQYH